MRSTGTQALRDPAFDGYQYATTRSIPVVALARRDGVAGSMA